MGKIITTLFALLVAANCYGFGGTSAPTPIATATKAGKVKIGEGLLVDVNGNLTSDKGFIAAFGNEISDQQYVSLTTAMTAATGKKLIITKQWTVTNLPMSLPGSVEIKPGGGFNNSGTLTFSIPVAIGNYKVFYGAGPVVFADGVIDKTIPEWWGFSATENAPFINSAITSAAGKVPVLFSGRTYNTIESVILKPKTVLRGVSPELSFIRQSGTAGATKYTIDVDQTTLDSYSYLYGYSLSRLKIGVASTNALGVDRIINFINVANSKIEDVNIVNGKIPLYVAHGMDNTYFRVSTSGAPGNTTAVFITGDSGITTGPGINVTTTQIFKNCTFSGGTTHLVVEPSKTLALGDGSSGNVVLDNCIAQSSSSSSIVIGAGTGISSSNLYVELAPTSGASPSIDLWSTGSYLTDSHNVATFTGGTYSGTGSHPFIRINNPQSVLLTGWRIIGTDSILDIPEPANCPVNSITLGNNFLFPSVKFINDSATYTQLVVTQKSLVGEVPVSWDHRLRERYRASDRVVGKYYSAPSTSGSAVLIGGTATVDTTEIAANSIVLLTNNLVGGTPGTLSVDTRVAGTSFVINSSSDTDTSTVGWIIFTPM
jgi:hypothetical protein